MAGRRTWSVVALVALVLAAVGAVIRGGAVDAAHQATTDADAVGASLERLLSSVANLEAAERGYAFTGKEIEAKALEAATSQAEGAIAGGAGLMAPLAADAPVEGLKLLVAEAIDRTRETTRLRRAEGQDSALRHAVSDMDTALLDRLQKTAREIATASRLSADQKAASARLRALLGGGLGVAGGLVAMLAIAMALFAKAPTPVVEEYRDAREGGSDVPMNAMLSALDDAVLAIDAHGKVVASNGAAEALLGLGEGGRAPALYAPDAGKKTPPAESPLLKALKGQPVRNAVLSVGRPNETGSKRVSVSAKPITEGERIRGAVMVIKDLQAGKGAEPPRRPDAQAPPEPARTEPRPPEEAFANVFEGAPTAIALIATDGRIVRANNALCRLLGCVEQELVGRDPGSLVNAEDAAKEQALLKPLFAGQSPSYEMEKRFTLPGKGKGKEKEAKRPVRWSVAAIRGPKGEVTGALAFADEVREKRSSDRESQDLLRVVLDALPVGVWITDGEGRVKLANPAGRRIWGEEASVARFEQGEYKGFWADTGKRIEPDDWGALRVIGTGEAEMERTIEVQRFDGSRKTLMTSAVPYRRGDGTVTGAIVLQSEVPPPPAAPAAAGGAEGAAAEVAVLRALLPLCPACENKRDEPSYWKEVRGYVRDHRADLRAASCRECSSRAYDLWSELIDEKTIL